MKYRVYLRTMASTQIEVEAESEEAAIEQAMDNTPYVCAQCAGWGQRAGIELGEWEPNDEPWAAIPADVAVEEVS